ncbi:MAG TPA: molybdenum cofactor guanylyltransferase [Bacteroidia bacterium]|nr:molybdenum cofactor guanylyltransferase [Bacteroidia bacterium]
MSDSNSKLNAYILAGGKSSRIGKDKGLLELQKKSLIEHVISRIKPAVNTICIVSSNQEYARFGYNLVRDNLQGYGPAGGIQAALTHSSDEKIFVISCDMPFVKSAAIKFLVKSSAGYDITIPMYKGKLEPLFGVYSTACAKAWEKHMKNGILKLQDLIETFNFQEIRVDSNPLFDDKLFTNLNTQTDFLNALIRLEHGH